MTGFGSSDDLRGARFEDVNLRGARFEGSDLSGVVMRGVEVKGLDIDSPWLGEGGSLQVNGVDVAPLVEAELNRRFPGRAGRGATDPDGLRGAWSAVQETWGRALERVATMPQGTVDVSVDGEWSFAQTLRHLVFATDVWLRKAILEVPQPYHPIGQTIPESAGDGVDLTLFATAKPPYAEVVEVRTGRVAMVTGFLAAVTADQLAEERRNPWAPDRAVTVLDCLHVILNEEWEHYRYALRDLAAIAEGAGAV